MNKDLLLKLANNNQHLSSIFSDEYYVELGNIPVDALEKLFNREVVNINEITYYPIQNSGIGHSNVNDEYAKNIIPFLYLNNINRKNNNRILFVTYGILKYTKSKKEQFVPIILIPVKLFFEQDEILIQKLASSIINPFVTRRLSSIGVEGLTLEEDTIYAIDNFCLSLTKYGMLSLELENYLTFGEVTYRDYMINANQFSLDITLDKYFDRMYSKDDDPMFINFLNKKQRKAVYASKENKSFTIVGPNGSGKTLTLKNIMLNAMYDGKQTLYISNKKESLDDVENFFVSEGLGNNVANLSKPYSALFNESNVEKNLQHLDVDLDQLKDDYDYINVFESGMGGRILDHRFVEIIDEIIKIKDSKPKILDIDDLSNIYRVEEVAIVKALEKIKKAIKGMGVLKESNWKSIPMINNIDNPDAIMELIKRIYDCFNIFKEEKEALENNFLTTKITDYAMLRKVVSKLENLNINDVPESWKNESLEGFKKAQNEFRRLKNNVLSLEAIEYELNQLFTGYDSINIDDEIDAITGKYYTKDDSDLIDEYFANRNDVMARVLDGNEQIVNYKKSLASIEKVAEFDFGQSNESLNALLELVKFIDSHELCRSAIAAISENKYDEYYNKVKKILEDIKSATLAIKDFSITHPKANEIKAKDILQSIEAYEKSDDKKVKKGLAKTIKKYFGRGNVEEQIVYVKKHFNNIQTLKNKRDEYFGLINEKYRPNTDILDKINDYKEFFNKLSSNSFKKPIAKIMLRACDSDNQAINKSLSNFRRTYYGLNDLTLFIRSNKITLSDDFNQRIEEIIEVMKYYREIYASNNRMKEIMKVKDVEYISSKMYYFLKESLIKKDNLRLHFENNTEYSVLFGNNYNGEKTNINKVSELLDVYNDFVESFISPKGFLEALKPSTYEKINTHLVRCRNTSDEINEIFKEYCHIFNDGVSRYYYNDLNDTIKYLEVLLNSKKELTLYLEATSGISVLALYNLEKFIEYISNLKDCNNLVNDFKYTYFKNIEAIYLDRYNELENYQKFLDKVEEVYKLEEKLINNNEERLLSRINKVGNRTYGLSKRYVDYNDFARRSNRQLILVSSDIANLYLDKDFFDLIIIDDAHLLPSSSYSDFILGKQVIICGEMPSHTSVINNLISKTRHVATISFDYRYTPMPKNLQSKVSGVCGLIPKKYSENCGVEVLTGNIYHYIYDAYQNNNDIVINIYIKRVRNQREFIEEFTLYFIEKGIDSKEVINILLNKINVCDLSSGYFYDSDFNVVYLDEYYSVDVDYISDNMIDDLLTTKSKVVIYDDAGILERDYVYRFAATVKKLLVCEENIPNILTDTSMETIKENLEVDGFKASISNDNIIYQYNEDVINANVVLWGNNETGESLNVYRDIYMTFANNGFKTNLIMKNDIVRKFELSLSEDKRGKNVQKRK